MAGEVNVDAMLRRITAKQFQEWEAYYMIEPFGETWDNYRTASICQMLANVNRGAKQKPYALTDFVLSTERDNEPQPGQTVKEKLAVLAVISRAWNAAQSEGPVNAKAAQAVAGAHGVALDG